MKIAITLLLFTATGSTYGAVTLDLNNQGTFVDPERDGSFEFFVTSPLDIGARPTLRAVRSGITFDFTSLHEVNKDKITAAELALFFDDVNLGPEFGGDELLELHTFTGTTNAIDVESDNLFAIIAPDQGAPFSIDVTDVIRNTVTSDPDFFGFSLRIERDLDPTTEGNARFLSPVLTVETAPERSLVLTQWDKASGGNGNFYGQVFVDPRLDWAEAKLDAEARTFMGVSGHLVTMTSSEEHLFVQSVSDRLTSWIGLTDDPAFGGTESFGQPNPQVDGWVWVTGEPVTFTNWWNPLVPNNQDGPSNSANFVGMADGQTIGGWNDFASVDFPGEFARYLIEFEAVPEPSGIFMAILGLLCFGLRQPRCLLDS